MNSILFVATIVFLATTIYLWIKTVGLQNKVDYLSDVLHITYCHNCKDTIIWNGTRKDYNQVCQKIGAEDFPSPLCPECSSNGYYRKISDARREARE